MLASPTREMSPAEVKCPERWLRWLGRPRGATCPSCAQECPPRLGREVGECALEPAQRCCSAAVTCWPFCSPPPPGIEPGRLLLFSCQVVSDSATPQTADLQASLSLILSPSLPKFMSTESVMNQASSLDLGGLCCLGPHEGRCSGSHGLEHVRACLLAFSGRPEGSPVFQMRKLEERGRDRLRQGLKARPCLWEEGVMAPLCMVFLNTWACLSSPGQALRGSRVAPAAKGDHMHAGLSEVTERPLHRAASQSASEDGPR